MGCWRSWRAGGGPISPEGESQAWAEAETIQTGAESESGECGGDLQGVRCRGGRGAQEGALDPGALPLFGEASPAEGACTVRLIRVIAELFTGRPSSGLVNGLETTLVQATTLAGTGRPRQGRKPRRSRLTRVGEGGSGVDLQGCTQSEEPAVDRQRSLGDPGWRLDGGDPCLPPTRERLPACRSARAAVLLIVTAWHAGL